MKNFVRNSVAFGLAASMAAGASMAEHGPEHEPLPLPAEASVAVMSDAPFADQEPLDTVDVRVIEVRDMSPSSRDLSPEIHAAAEVAYPQFADMIREHTLGTMAVELSDITVVTLARDISAELCATADKGAWYQKLNAARREALRVMHHQEGQRAQENVLADTTVYNLTFETCNPYNRTQSNGQPFKIAGWGEYDSDITIFGYPDATLLAHELGHAVWRLNHAGMQARETSSNPDEQSSFQEYGSDASIMGDSLFDSDSFSGYELARIEALQPWQIVDITSSGTYDLEALRNEGNGVKLLRVVTDDESWIGDAIANTDPRDLNIKPADYKRVPEAVYIELSSDNAYQECTETLCEPGESIKIFRAPRDFAREDQEEAPYTMQLNLEVGMKGASAGAAYPGILYDHAGTQIELQSIGPNGAGGHGARLYVTLPSSREQTQLYTPQDMVYDVTRAN